MTHQRRAQKTKRVATTRREATMKREKRERKKRRMSRKTSFQASTRPARTPSSAHQRNTTLKNAQTELTEARGSRVRTAWRSCKYFLEQTCSEQASQGGSIAEKTVSMLLFGTPVPSRIVHSCEYIGIPQLSPRAQLVRPYNDSEIHSLLSAPLPAQFILLTARAGARRQRSSASSSKAAAAASASYLS